MALLIAIFLLCLVGRSYTAAGFVIGMGVALKLTRLALLPLVLLLAGPRRRVLVAFPVGCAMVGTALDDCRRRSQPESSDVDWGCLQRRGLWPYTVCQGWGAQARKQ